MAADFLLLDETDEEEAVPVDVPTPEEEEEEEECHRGGHIADDEEGLVNPRHCQGEGRSVSSAG